MRPLFLSLIAAATAHAQIVVPAGPDIVVEESVHLPLEPPSAVVEVVPAVEVIEERSFDPIDPVFVRRHFAMDPRVIERSGVPAMPPRVVEVETTVIEEVQHRVYDPRRRVVVVVEEEIARELPYVEIPVLFVKGTAELLDTQSRHALEEMAALVLEVRQTEPEAVFDIEGHTSTEGTYDFNMRLSIDRARRVYDELTRRYGVPREMLTAHGYGENYPNYPDGSEAERMLDRRVLLVRVK